MTIKKLSHKKHRFTFNGLHALYLRRYVELFAATAVRISNPEVLKLL